MREILDPSLMVGSLSFKLLDYLYFWTGIDLKQPVSKETILQIKEDVTKNRLLIFKDQGVVPPERQIEITQWFGEVK